MLFFQPVLRPGKFHYGETAFLRSNTRRLKNSKNGSIAPPAQQQKENQISAVRVYSAVLRVRMRNAANAQSDHVQNTRRI